MSVFILIPRKVNAKEFLNYCTFVFISHVSSKSFKLGFSSMRTENFQIYRLGLEKVEKPELNIHQVTKKAREFQKKHLLLPH